MKDDDYEAELAEIERWGRQLDRGCASVRFLRLYGRLYSDEDELSRFIAQEQALEARSQQEQAAREERKNALYQSVANKYDQWLKSLFFKLTKVLGHQKPDRDVALQKLISNEPDLKALVAAGGLSISLPFSDPDLTGEAKAAFSTLCRGLEGAHMGELEEALNWKAEYYFFAFPYAEYIDKARPCLAFTAKAYGIIAIEISKKSSFEKSIWLYSVKAEKLLSSERSFTVEASPPYFLGYHWDIWDVTDIGRSTKSLIVPIILLDSLAKGQIEAEGVRVQARQGDRTFYSVKGSDETIAISDSFTEFLRRVKQPWYQDMARLGVLDTHTSEIVQLKLTQSTSPSTASQQGWSDDDFVDCLTSPALGLSAVVAKEKLKILKGKNIDRNISLEDAVKLSLRELAR